MKQHRITKIEEHFFTLDAADIKQALLEYVARKAGFEPSQVQLQTEKHYAPYFQFGHNVNGAYGPIDSGAAVQIGFTARRVSE